MKMRFFILVLLCCMEASAADEGLFTSAGAAGGTNPVIGRISADVYYRIPLSSDSGILWNSTCLDLGMNGSMTPVDYNASGYLNIEPIAFFNLKLTTTIQQYHTLAGYGYQEMKSPDSDYSLETLSDIKGESKTACKYSAEPTMKFSFSRFIFADTFTVNHIIVSTSDRYYYEPYSDTVHERDDWNYANSASLLYEVNNHLLAGVNNYYNKTESTGYRSNRIAAIVMYSSETENSDKINIGFLAGTYTENKNYKNDLYAVVFAVYTIKQ
jgi:hypothetical protein